MFKLYGYKVFAQKTEKSDDSACTNYVQFSEKIFCCIFFVAFLLLLLLFFLVYF